MFAFSSNCALSMPTMTALHEGHAKLLWRESLKLADLPRDEVESDDEEEDSDDEIEYNEDDNSDIAIEDDNDDYMDDEIN